MSRKTALVKISGELCSRQDVIAWLRGVATEYFTVIVIGGGTQINAALEKAGFAITAHGPLGRETTSFQEKQLARDVLEQNQVTLQDRLATEGIVATVVIPVLDIGSVLCHVNGDTFVLSAYLGFDKIFLMTLEARADQKKSAFERYPKIEVVSFPG